MAKRIIGLIIGILVLVIVVYAGLIIFDDPFAGKENEIDVINQALNVLELDSPGWQTVIVAASGETNVPIEIVWETWSNLEEWAIWSQPLHESAEWSGDSRWEVDSEFVQVLNLGNVLGIIESRETITEILTEERVMWCKDENDIQSCHIWQFDATGNGGTRIINIEVFHGTSIGLIKPLVRDNIQQLFEASVAGLIEYIEN